MYTSKENSCWLVIKVLKFKRFYWKKKGATALRAWPRSRRWDSLSDRLQVFAPHPYINKAAKAWFLSFAANILTQDVCDIQTTRQALRCKLTNSKRRKDIRVLFATKVTGCQSTLAHMLTAAALDLMWAVWGGRFVPLSDPEDEGKDPAVERSGLLVVGGKRRKLWHLQDALQWLLPGLWVAKL